MWLATICYVTTKCTINAILTFSRFSVFAQYTNSNTRIPTASSPANTNNSSSSSSNTNGGTSLQSSNQPTTSSPSSECQSAAPAAQQLSKTNLYIRGLSQNTTDKDLVTMCSQWVCRQNIILNPTIVLPSPYSPSGMSTFFTCKNRIAKWRLWWWESVSSIKYKITNEYRLW